MKRKERLNKHLLENWAFQVLFVCPNSSLTSKRNQTRTKVGYNYINALVYIEKTLTKSKRSFIFPHQWPGTTLNGLNVTHILASHLLDLSPPSLNIYHGKNIESHECFLHYLCLATSLAFQMSLCLSFILKAFLKLSVNRNICKCWSPVISIVQWLKDISYCIQLEFCVKDRFNTRQIRFK